MKVTPLNNPEACYRTARAIGLDDRSELVPWISCDSTDFPVDQQVDLETSLNNAVAWHLSPYRFTELGWDLVWLPRRNRRCDYTLPKTFRTFFVSQGAGISYGDGLKIIDPCCGSGTLLETIQDIMPKAHIQGIDRHLDNTLQVEIKGFEAIWADALEWNGYPADDYDLIFLVPPEDEWIDHLSQAIEHVKPGGQVIAIAPWSEFYCRRAGLLRNILAQHRQSTWERLEWIDGLAFRPALIHFQRASQPQLDFWADHSVGLSSYAEDLVIVLNSEEWFMKKSLEEKIATLDYSVLKAAKRLRDWFYWTPAIREEVIDYYVQSECEP